MPPPVAVYVVAAVVGAAAIFAFKEFVYEPHIAPKFEAWAEDFLERRRAARSRRASAVPVRASHRRNSTSSSDTSHHSNDHQRDQDENYRELGQNDVSLDGFELEALASREVHEWRNEVLRSQERTMDGLRKRRTGRLIDDFDGFDNTTTSLDESFTSLTHTTLASTHVISNVSSPFTPSTVSLPLTPTRHSQSESQSTTAQGDVSAFFVHPLTPIHETQAMSPMTVSPSTADRTLHPFGDHLDIASPSPLAIPDVVLRSLATESVPRPLTLTPTNQDMADDSPFGPLLPDTPRSSAEMYGERPFSPITRAMGSSSGLVSADTSKGTLSSRVNSTGSIRTLGGSGVLRKSSGLANEVVASDSDDSSDEDDHLHAPASAFESVVSSLSERYPAPPTPPVVISPRASSAGIISAPSSPGSGSSAVVVQHDTIAPAPHLLSRPPHQTHLSPPLLRLPSDSSSPRPSPAHSATSPALSYASFLSPMPVSRTASESEGDEFLSVAGDDSDWSESPVTPGGRTSPGVVRDRGNNPFLDFEHLMHDVGGGASEHEDGSEESEVLVSEHGQEGGSEMGSDESWGSAMRH